MFEAEFSFNTSEFLWKDLAVLVVSLAVVYGATWAWLRKQEANDAEGSRA